MTGIDDLIICPQCLKPMGDDITVTTCQYCGYKEGDRMNEKRLIHGSYGEQRYLHSDEIFRKERNWNINLPSEREFKDGYCIITDRDNTAYSIDELVELLNEFQNENKKLKRVMGESVIERLLDGFEESYKDLEKENEDLKKMLDNIANYMQKEHKEIPIDDFVEWWNNIVRNGLE